MALHPPLFVTGASAGVTQPKDARLALSALLPAVGVVSGGAVTGSTSGPNMKYNIAAGNFVTARGTIAADGVYLINNDGTVLIDSGSPAPSSGSRWDLVWVRALNAFGSDGFGDANSIPTFGVTSGSSGSTPTKPYGSVPAGALVLAESSVGTSIANSTSATITLVAPPTGVRGGILPVSSSTVYPSAPYPGQTVYDMALSSQVVWNGSQWIPERLQWQYKKSDTPVIASGAFVKFVLNTQVIDTGAVGLAGGAFVAPFTGTYRASGAVGFGASGTGRRAGALSINPGATPSPIDGSESFGAANSAGITLLTLPSLLVPMSAGDVLALIGYQDSGSSLAVGVSQLTVELT